MLVYMYNMHTCVAQGHLHDTATQGGEREGEEEGEGEGEALEQDDATGSCMGYPSRGYHGTITGSTFFNACPSIVTWQGSAVTGTRLLHWTR